MTLVTEINESQIDLLARELIRTVGDASVAEKVPDPSMPEQRPPRRRPVPAMNTPKPRLHHVSRTRKHGIRRESLVI